ncbi:hypothetical protein ACL02T_16585 [Pseudonocardia sp. RS010]|uniref:hypothetical protein n=1 Tax=Pseudonocardia sp. RS010 TaxID=3385979 RepID=UPI0039A0F6F8
MRISVTGRALAAAAEGDHGLLQLVGVGLGLGVVDHEVLAAGEEEPDVARLGLRLRLAGRDDQEGDVLGRIRRLGGLDRLGVALLEQQQDRGVQPLLGPFHQSRGDQHRPDPRPVPGRHLDRPVPLLRPSATSTSSIRMSMPTVVMIRGSRGRPHPTCLSCEEDPTE